MQPDRPHQSSNSIARAGEDKPPARFNAQLAHLFARKKRFDAILLRIFDERMRKINESALSCLDSGKNG